MKKGKSLLSELVDVFVRDIPEIGYEGGAVATSRGASASALGESETAKQKQNEAHHPAIM